MLPFERVMHVYSRDYDENNYDVLLIDAFTNDYLSYSDQFDREKHSIVLEYLIEAVIHKHCPDKKKLAGRGFKILNK